MQVRARLQVLSFFSDLVYTNWRMLSYDPGTSEPAWFVAARGFQEFGFILYNNYKFKNPVCNVFPSLLLFVGTCLGSTWTRAPSGRTTR